MQLASNKRARFDYDIKDTFDAGLVLTGAEVKAAKQGNVSLQGSFIKVGANSASLINCHIGPYKYAPNENYNPTQSRKILLKKSEIQDLLGKDKGLTVLPLEMYANSRGLVKLKIGIGKGRKKTDKREYLKTRDAKREARQSL
jgi:SsrA-binding protein